MRKLSCSFQDGAPRDRPAKSLQPNDLDPELSCSLQDAGDGVFGHGRAVAVGSASLLPDAPSNTASDSRDALPAISSGYRAPLGDTQGLSPASGGENRRGAGADNPADHKLVVGDGAERAETKFGSKGNGAARSQRLLRVRDEISEENRNPGTEQEKSEKNKQSHRESPGDPRKTDVDQLGRAQCGNFWKAPKPLGCIGKKRVI